MNYDDIAFILKVPSLDSLGHNAHQAQRRRMMVRPWVPLDGSSERLFLRLQFAVEVVSVFLQRTEVEDTVVWRVRLQEAEHVGPAAHRREFSSVLPSKWGKRERDAPLVAVEGSGPYGRESHDDDPA